MMKASEIKTTITALMDANLPIFLWGSSGIGKSSIIKEVSAVKEMNLVQLDLSLYKESKELSFLFEEETGILHLHDVDVTSARVHALMLHLMIQMEDHSLKGMKSWQVIVTCSCAGDEEDRFHLPVHLANRFVHLQMKVDADEWRQWAFQSGIDERVIAYIAYQESDLLHLSLKKNIFPSPRSWMLVSKILRSNIDENMLLNVLSGTVGETTAETLLTFTQGIYKLPDIEAILSTAKAHYPHEEDVLHMLCTVLVSFLLKYDDETNVENVLVYAYGLPDTFSIRILKDLQRGGIAMEHLSGFKQLSSKFSQMTNE